jgi:hypothetical protein
MKLHLLITNGKKAFVLGEHKLEYRRFGYIIRLYCKAFSVYLTYTI